MHTGMATHVIPTADDMPLSTHNFISSNDEVARDRDNDWHLWCRLCAKEDLIGNINIFLKDEQSSGCRESVVCGIGNSTNLTLSEAIGKYFWVDIKRDEALPKMLCTECFSLVTSLVNFSERVSKVQQMFCALLNKLPGTPLNMNEIRSKYGLLDEDREHVLLHHHLPEVHYFESKPKINDLEENIFENEATAGVTENPLEQPRIKIKIKKENILESNPTAGNEDNKNDDNLLNDEEEDDCEEDDDDDDDDDDDEYKIENEEDSDEDVALDDSKLAEADGERPKVKPFKIRINSQTAAGSIIENEDKPQEELPNSRRKRKISNKDEDDFNYVCTDCPRKFKQMFHFRQHLKRAHPKTALPPELPCKQCSKVFGTPRQLEIHTQIHLPTELRKTVSCPYCDKKFSSHTLQTHIKYVHMKERPFVCEECGIAVRTNAALKTHMLTHTDYAPYECDICKKGFKSQIRLKNHLETHDPNKHVCDECGLQLNSRSTLNRHLLVHSDEMQHKCDYCGRAFKRAKALKNHLILHTGLKPYSCDFCDRTFANGSNCRSHKKKAHPDELAAQEAAGVTKAYTKNIPKLEALKAVTKAADNLAPVVSKQSGCFAFGKKPKPPPPKDTLNEKQSKKPPSAAAKNKDQPLQHSTSNMILNSSAASINTLHANTALSASNPQNHITPSSGIPNIDNIYSHIMKQATIVAHNASVLDAATELTRNMKRPPSEASSCVTLEHDGTSDISTMQQRQHMQSASPAVSSISSVPAHFYTEIIKQNLQNQHEHEQQQQHHHLHPQQHNARQQNQNQQLHTPSTADGISSIRSPDSATSSHMGDEQSNAASVQFYNHIRQNLQGPYM